MLPTERRWGKRPAIEAMALMLGVYPDKLLAQVSLTPFFQSVLLLSDNKRF
jgi:hypothetical protein